MNECIEFDAASCVCTYDLLIGHLNPLPVLLNIISITSSFNQYRMVFQSQFWEYIHTQQLKVYKCFDFIY